METKTNIHVGYRIGKLEVVKLKREDKRGQAWLCKCDCGNEIILNNYQLVEGGKRRPNKSCGCSEHQYSGRVAENLRLYHTWYGMKRRCYDEKSGSYKRYGAKGITVDEVWIDDFENFLDWSLSNGYKDGLTLDRIDSKLGYSPSNCRWVTYNKQMQTRGRMGNNTTGVTGVSYSKKQNKYNAYIQRDGIQKNLGLYDSLERAKEARISAEKHYKEYGTLSNYN
ncbi:hypothetical protein [Enterococcus gallinarum]|uniref:hypothetical protein n=1 Tax=Enterococcus gallinarum TaxID=1353 RepID=UPI0035CAE3FF